MADEFVVAAEFDNDVAAPTLAPEPSFTSGTANTLFWSRPFRTDAFYLEWSANASFAGIAGQSGWTTATQWTATTLTDGQRYYYHVKARSTSMTESAWSPAVFSTQDVLPPQTHVLALPTYETSALFNVAWTGSDTASGLNSVRLFYRRGDSGPYTQYGSEFTSSPIAFNSATTGGDGIHCFYTVGTDNLGHEEGAPATWDARTQVVTTPPAAPLLGPEPAFTAGTSNRIWYAPPTSATACYMEWATNAAFLPVAGNCGWIAVPQTNYTATNLADGQTYYYRAKARNAASLQSGWSNVVSSRQDATPPQTSAGALPTYRVTPTFQIPWSGSDTVSGLASVRLFYRRGTSGAFVQYGTTFTLSPIAFNSALTGGDGAYEFYTRGKDRVNNEERAPLAADARTTVLTVAPAAPVMTPEPQFTRGTSNQVRCGAIAGAAAYWFEWSTTATFTMALHNSGWTTSTAWTATGLPDGQTCYYRVKARNAALLQSGWSNVVSSRQDASAPQSRVLALPALTVGTTFTIRSTASDAVSGVKEVRLHYRRGTAGAYWPWPTPFTSGTLVFNVTGTGGSGTYQFYSVARDNVDNLEAVPSVPDAQTVVETTPRPTQAGRWMLFE
jgi:hypothetical protein